MSDTTKVRLGAGAGDAGKAHLADVEFVSAAARNVTLFENACVLRLIVNPVIPQQRICRPRLR